MLGRRRRNRIAHKLLVGKRQPEGLHSGRTGHPAEAGAALGPTPEGLQGVGLVSTDHNGCKPETGIRRAQWGSCTSYQPGISGEAPDLAICGNNFIGHLSTGT